MKILFVNLPSELNGKFFKRAGVRWPAIGEKYSDPKDPGRYVAFPFFLAYSAAIMRNKNHNVFVIDAVALQLDEDVFYKEVLKRMPDLTVIETSTPTISLDLKYAEWIKQKTNSKILLVGPHASVFPKDMLSNSFVDFVAIGEYENTVDELTEKLDNNQLLNNVKGLAFRDNEKVIINERRELIEPLDNLPFPARDIFPIDDVPDIGIYWDGICSNYPAIKIATSRGCPFGCNYCLWTQVMYPGQNYRMFSPKRVVDEIEYVIEKYGAKEIYFDDDTFTGNEKHAIAICKEMKKRGVNIPWSAMCDAIITTHEMIKEMSEAGCKTVMFGLESADLEVLKRIGKPIDLKKIKQVLLWCREFNITTRVTNCFGLTGDNEETIRKTFEFASKLPADSVQFSVAIPYPGTRFYDEVKSKGYLDDEKWSSFDGRALVSYPHLSSARIAELAQQYSNEYHSLKRRNPSWLLTALKRTYREKGVKGLIAMTSRNITRVFQGKY